MQNYLTAETDPVYAGRPRIPPEADDTFVELLRNFGRQALHAWKLSLIHPESGEETGWQADMPGDMQKLLIAMQDDLDKHG